MKKRKYARRRRRLNPRFVIMVLTLAALVTLLVAALVHRDEPDPQPQPEEFVPGAILPEQDPTTETTTGPTTMPTTEPDTEPTTDPTEESTEQLAPESSPVGAQVAEIARQQIGKSYLYGGVGPDAFDASGLVVYCYAACGVEVPRIAKYQVEAGVEVSVEDLEPGDVIFFWTENPGTAEYEGIYVGNGKIVAARNGDKPVSEMNLWTEYFTTRYLCARRYY